MTIGQSRPDADGAACSDDGAAVVDFVMISVLLIFLLLSVLQVAIFFYARNVTSSAAAQAARYAAAAGSGPQAGTARAQALVRAGLDAGDARGIHCAAAPGRDAVSGLATVTVTCGGRLRLLFLPLHLPLRVDARSTVLREHTP